MGRTYNGVNSLFLPTSLKQSLRLALLFIAAGVLDTATTFYMLAYTEFIELNPFFVPFLSTFICLFVVRFCFWLAPKAKGGYFVAWGIVCVMLFFAFAPGVNNLVLLLS